MKRFRAPIWLVLAIATAGLVVLTTAVEAAAVKAELQPAEYSSPFLSTYILSDRVSVNDVRRIQDLLLGSLAASPQVIGVAFIRSDLYTMAAARSANGMPFAPTAHSAVDDS